MSPNMSFSRAGSTFNTYFMFPQLLPILLLYPPVPLKLNHLETFMNQFKVLKALNRLNHTCYSDKICRQKYEKTRPRG